MTAAEAAKIKVGTELPYPANWPGTGQLELVRPCKVLRVRESPFSDSGYLFTLAGTENNRRIELDAGWFKTPTPEPEPEPETNEFGFGV